MYKILVFMSICVLLIPTLFAQEIIDRPLEAKYEKAKNIYIDLAWATYLRASRRFPEARDIYQRVLHLHKSSAFTHSQLANVSLAIRDIRTADQESRLAIEINPENPLPHFILAQVMFKRTMNSRQKNWKPVIEQLRKVTQLDPDHVDAYQYLGEIAATQEDPKLGKQAFKQLTRLMPYRPVFFLRLGNAYEDLGYSDKAISSYERAVKIDDTMWQAHKSLGRLYTASYELAENGVYNTNDPTAESIDSAVEKITKAILAYAKMRQYAPNIPKQFDKMLGIFRARLGSLYLTVDRPQQAIDTLNKIFTEDPKHADANYLLGLSYQEMKDFEKAEFHLRNAIRISPERSEPYNALGYLLAELGTDLEYAVDIIKIALKKEPENGAYLDSLGWTYFKMGENELARIELEKAVKFESESWEIQDHLGDVYLKIGMKNNAIDAWRKATILNPENEKIRQKIERYHAKIK